MIKEAIKDFKELIAKNLRKRPGKNPLKGKIQTMSNIRDIIS